jgi:hypothetical protein
MGFAISRHAQERVRQRGYRDVPRRSSRFACRGVAERLTRGAGPRIAVGPRPLVGQSAPPGP